MWFRFDKLEDSGVTFTRAIRQMVIGGETRWQLTRGERTSTRECVLEVETDGRLDLGRVQWSSDNLQWHDINASESVAIDWPGTASAIRTELTGVSTTFPLERSLPQRRVTGFQISPGQLLLTLGLSNTNRVQTLLDQELAFLPDGKVPLFLQMGQSDLESLAWLQVVLTDQVARNVQFDSLSSHSPVAIVLTGSDGDGWHLVPLHQLKDRQAIPDVPLPTGCERIEFTGSMSIPCGCWAKRWDERSMCRQFKGRGTFDAALFSDRPVKHSILPLRLPRTMLPPDLQKKYSSDQWVIEQRDIFTHEGKHEIELLACEDPARFIGPAAPLNSNRPGGLYRVRVKRVPKDVPNWTVDCQILGLSSPEDVPVKLSTPYAATESVGGLHLVPEPETELLAAWDGSLSDFPTMLTAPRPVAESSRGASSIADVRDLGRLAFEPARDRDFAVSIPKGTLSIDIPSDSGGSLQAFVDKDITLASLNGNITFQRDAGRVFQIGQNFVDIDPTNALPAVVRQRRKRSTARDSKQRTTRKVTSRGKQSPQHKSTEYCFSIASVSWIDPASQDRFGFPLQESDRGGRPRSELPRSQLLGKELYRFANFLEASITVGEDNPFSGSAITRDSFTSASGLYTNTSFLGTKVEEFSPIQQSERLPSDGLRPEGVRFVQVVGCRTQAPEKIAKNLGQDLGAIAGCWAAIKYCSRLKNPWVVAGCCVLGGSGVGPFGGEVGQETVEELYVFPPIWTKLELTIYRDGSFNGRLLAHSIFPSVSLYTSIVKRPPQMDAGAQTSIFSQGENYDGVPHFKKWSDAGWNAGNPWNIPSPSGFGRNR
jgi:hypothetical protein